jgi:hypothetical protein
MQKIIFHSAQEYNFKNFIRPLPARSSVPEWFSSSNRNWVDTDGNILDSETLSFKACPALMDSFVSGYFLLTPCDIHFYKINGEISVSLSETYKAFCESRPIMGQFPVPHGCEETAFHWFPNWMPELPEGYSGLYVHPINRFDLPFITTSGIIDNDRVSTPGLMPFFIKKDFVGTISAGTPYIQIIPFKREIWEMEKKFYSASDIIDRRNESAKRHRVKGGGGYKKTDWTRKTFT